MGVMEKFFLDKDQAVLVIIDVQEKLCRAMDEKVLERLTGNINVLQEAAVEMGIPVVVTEQYVKGLGETLAPIRKKLAGTCSCLRISRIFGVHSGSGPSSNVMATWFGLYP